MKIYAITKRLGAAALVLALALSLAAPAGALLPVGGTSVISSVKSIPDVLVPGEQSMLQITVKNNAPTADSGIVIVLEILPLILPDVAMISMEDSSPKYIAWQKDKNTYYFNIGSIPANSSATITLGVTVADESPSGQYPGGCKAYILYSGIIPGNTTSLTLYIDLPADTGEQPEPDLKDIVGLPDRFDDDDAHWAQTFINILADAGIVNGVGENKFGPDMGLTRAMVAQILYNLYGGGESVPDGPFGDLTEQWYINAVNWAAKNGIAPSATETEFAPGSPAPREEVLLVFAKMAALRSAELPAVRDKQSFGDDGDISPDAYEAVYAFQRAGIVAGDDLGCFNPKSQITRAEFTKILCLYLDAVGELDYDISSLK